MGAFLSRLWTEIAHLVGWQLPQTQTASQNVLHHQPDSTRVDADDELTVDAPTDFTSPQESETGETSLRRRITKTPERDSDDRDSEPPSPRKSNWEESAEHPKPKLDAVPPTKKTKEDKKEENRAANQVHTMQFESSPNVQFGSEGCPESLLPVCMMKISVYAELLNVLNDHVDDRPSEQPRLLQSRNAEPHATEDSLQTNLQHINQYAEIRGRNAGGEGESPSNPIQIFGEDDSEILGGAGEGIENTEKEVVGPPNTVIVLRENLKLSSVVENGSEECQNFLEIHSSEGSESQNPLPERLQEEYKHLGCETQESFLMHDSDKMTSQEDTGRVDAAPEFIQENPEHPSKMDSEEDSEMTDDSVESPKESPEHPRYETDDYEKMDSEEDSETTKDSLESTKETQEHSRYQTGDAVEVDDYLQMAQEDPKHPQIQMRDSDKINTQEDAEMKDESPEELSSDSAVINAQKDGELQESNLVMSSENLEHLQGLPRDSAEVSGDSVVARDTKFVVMGHQEAQECCLHDIYVKDTEDSKDLTENVESESDSSFGNTQELEEDLDENASMVLEAGSADSSVDDYVFQGLKVALDVLIELDVAFQEQQHKDLLQQDENGEEAKQHDNAPELVERGLPDSEQNGVSLEREIKANSTDFESEKQLTELQSDGADVVSSNSDFLPIKEPETVDALTTSVGSDMDLEREIKANSTDFESEKQSTELQSDGADAVASNSDFPPIKEPETADALSTSLGSDMDLTCEISERDLNGENVADFTDKKEQIFTETAGIMHKNGENQGADYQRSNDSDSLQESNKAEQQENLSDQDHCSQATDLCCQQESEIEYSTAGNKEQSVEKNAEFSAEKNACQTEEIVQENAEVQNFSSENTEHISPNLPQKFHADIKTSKLVNVQWIGSAEEVFITGSWLDWDGRVPLEKSDENVWSADVEFDLSLKEIKLKFIVDGSWLTSPDMPSVFDGFGNRNNIIRLMH